MRDFYIASDWMDFTSWRSLGRKAGVRAANIPKLVVKELADNALDCAGAVDFELLPDGSLIVANPGKSLEGTDKEIAKLFSVRRAQFSTKRIHRAGSRGQLGNGLRVVAGACASTGGCLQVSTSGRVLQLTPQKTDGQTKHERIDKYTEEGTRIQVWLGRDAPHFDLEWGRLAAALAALGTQPKKDLISAHWHTAEEFYNLLRMSGDRTLQQEIVKFDGCTGRAAAEIAKDFLRKKAVDIGADEAAAILKRMRDRTREVKPTRLGAIGHCEELGSGYGKVIGTIRMYDPTYHLHATVPFVIEAWATVADVAEIQVCVNRTPIAADMQAQYSKERRAVDVFECGLKHNMYRGPHALKMLINLQTPSLSLTNDGKEPNLFPYLDCLRKAIGIAGSSAEKLGRSIRRAQNRSGGSTVIDVVDAGLQKAMEETSDGGKVHFTLRNLWYTMHPHLPQTKGNEERRYQYFSKLIDHFEDAYKAEHGTIRGSYFELIERDERGSLYIPHSGVRIPLGTASVRNFERPEWHFNKCLVIEKEGFLGLLVSEGWPEKNDCAILSAKGYTTRAIKDVIDMLGDGDETIWFFALTDFDSYGTMIMQTLKEETRIRPGRKVEIEHLGLNRQDVSEWGLTPEDVQALKGGHRRTVARNLSQADADWLQTHRVEINTLPPRRLLEYLDAKFKPFAGKLVPPTDVLMSELERDLVERVREQETERILWENDLEGNVKQQIERLAPAREERLDSLHDRVTVDLAPKPKHSWRKAIADVVAEIMNDGTSGS